MTDVAIAGVGYTSFTRKSGRSVLDLAAEACRNAAADAGLALREIDGVGSFSVFNDLAPVLGGCHRAGITDAALHARSERGRTIAVPRNTDGRIGDLQRLRRRDCDFPRSQRQVGRSRRPWPDPRRRRRLSLSDRLQLLFDVHRDVGAPLHDRNRRDRGRTWRGRRGATLVRTTKQPCRRSRAARYRDLLSFAAGLRPVPRCRLHFGS